METTNAKVYAVSGSLGVHLLMVLVLYLGLMHQTELVVASAQGPAIEATLVSAPQQAVATIHHIETKQPVVQSPPPQPVPEPHPQNAPQPPQIVPQVRLPKADTVDQDEIRRAGVLAAQLKKQQEQEEKSRQAQIDLSAKKAQEQAESRQRLAAEAEAKKKADDALRDLEVQKKKMDLINQRQAQLALNNTPHEPTPAPAPVPAGNDGLSSSLIDRYRELLKHIVHLNWHSEGVVPRGVHCMTHYVLLQDGQYAHVDEANITFSDCPYDAAARASVVDALTRQPLPYAQFSNVFNKVKEGTIDMCDPEEACK